MIYAILEKDNKEESYLFDNFRELNEASWNPCVEEKVVIEFIVKGKTYAEKQRNLKEKAVEWSHSQWTGGIDLFELTRVANWFETNGRRYGLLGEFHENAIC